MGRPALSDEQSRTLLTLEQERLELQRQLLKLEGDVEYHTGMAQMFMRNIEEIELKIQDLSQSIIALDNA